MDRETIIQTGISTTATGGSTPPRSWTCRVTSGEERGRTVSIGARPVIVGADSSCDLVLTDPTVSRRHTEIRVSSDGILVRDLGSTNGTYYQSSRISEVVIPDEASIRVGQTRLKITAVPAQTVPPSKRTRFGGMVGESLAMREMFGVLELASPSEATILMEGESGTGKELAARAIHDRSPRAEGPFVVVDCGATQEQLVESHLYGHVRGAFTGAVSARKGAFVNAGGGTLFLDEIGELPMASQAKLLRAIEARTIQPLGSDRTLDVDVRIVAATHRELARRVEEGSFRFDLFQRLAVVHIRIPPLRERPEDIPALVRHFYEGRCADPGEIGNRQLGDWQRHAWPGNVRELRNALERAWVLSGSGVASFNELKPFLGRIGGGGQEGIVETSLPFKEAKERWLEQFERRYIAAVFASNERNISRAAAQAGINRNHFRKLLLKFGLLEK